jgi:AbrB family looped-hinge helix DNA binding protein
MPPSNPVDDIVTVSPTFQVVVPKRVRESLQLRPGMRLRVTSVDGQVDLSPLRSMRSYRGSLKGLDTSLPRDDDRR